MNQRSLTSIFSFFLLVVIFVVAMTTTATTILAQEMTRPSAQCSLEPTPTQRTKMFFKPSAYEPVSDDASKAEYLRFKHAHAVSQTDNGAYLFVGTSSQSETATNYVYVIRTSTNRIVQTVSVTQPIAAVTFCGETTWKNDPTPMLFVVTDTKPPTMYVYKFISNSLSYLLDRSASQWAIAGKVQSMPMYLSRAISHYRMPYGVTNSRPPAVLWFVKFTETINVPIVGKKDVDREFAGYVALGQGGESGFGTGACMVDRDRYLMVSSTANDIAKCASNINSLASGSLSLSCARIENVKFQSRLMVWDGGDYVVMWTLRVSIFGDESDKPEVGAVARVNWKTFDKVDLTSTAATPTECHYLLPNYTAMTGALDKANNLIVAVDRGRPEYGGGASITFFDRNSLKLLSTEKLTDVVQQSAGTALSSSEREHVVDVASQTYAIWTTLAAGKLYIGLGAVGTESGILTIERSTNPVTTTTAAEEEPTSTTTSSTTTTMTETSTTTTTTTSSTSSTTTQTDPPSTPAATTTSAADSATPAPPPSDSPPAAGPTPSTPPSTTQQNAAEVTTQQPAAPPPVPGATTTKREESTTTSATSAASQGTDAPATTASTEASTTTTAANASTPRPTAAAPPPLEPLLPDQKTSATTLSFFAAPAPILSIRALASAGALVGCEKGAREAKEKNLTSTTPRPLGWSENLFFLKIGDTDLETYAGSVVSAIIVVVLVLSLGFLFAFVRSECGAKDKRGQKVNFQRALLKVHHPSTAAIGIAVVAPPMLTAGVVLAFHPLSGMQWLGGIGIAIALLPLPLYVFLHRHFSRHEQLLDTTPPTMLSKAQREEDERRQRQENSQQEVERRRKEEEIPGLSEIALLLFDFLTAPRKEYAKTNITAAFKFWVENHKTVLFAFIDYAFTMFTAAAAGISMCCGTELCCQISSDAVAAIAVLYLCVLAYAQPMLVRFDAFNIPFMTFLTAVTSILAVVASYMGNADVTGAMETATEGIFYGGIISMVVCTFANILPTIMWIWSKVCSKKNDVYGALHKRRKKRLTRALRKHRREERDEREKRRREAAAAAAAARENGGEGEEAAAAAALLAAEEEEEEERRRRRSEVEDESNSDDEEEEDEDEEQQQVAGVDYETEDNEEEQGGNNDLLDTPIMMNRRSGHNRSSGAGHRSFAPQVVSSSPRNLSQLMDSSGHRGGRRSSTGHHQSSPSSSFRNSSNSRNGHNNNSGSSTHNNVFRSSARDADDEEMQDMLFPSHSSSSFRRAPLSSPKEGHSSFSRRRRDRAAAADGADDRYYREKRARDRGSGGGGGGDHHRNHSSHRDRPSSSRRHDMPFPTPHATTSSSSRRHDRDRDRDREERRSSRYQNNSGGGGGGHRHHHRSSRNDADGEYYYGDRDADSGRQRTPRSGGDSGRRPSAAAAALPNSSSSNNNSRRHQHESSVDHHHHRGRRRDNDDPYAHLLDEDDDEPQPRQHRSNHHHHHHRDSSRGAAAAVATSSPRTPRNSASAAAAATSHRDRDSRRHYL